MNIHKDVTLAAVQRAVENAQIGLDDPGFCVACGKEHDGIEPDARGYECEFCGEDSVFGAEELLLMLTA